MAPNIQQLHIERGVPKATLTKVEKFIDSEGANATKEALLMRVESLNNALSSFEKIQRNIYEIIDPSDLHSIQLEQNEAIDFEERVATARTMLNLLLDALTNPHKEPPASDLSQLVSLLADAIGNKEGKEQITRNRLPELPLKKFSGDYREWSEFRDSFNDNIHSRTDLSKQQKFRYLKGFVEGEAASIFKQLPSTEDHYEDAWKLLERRYDKKQSILFGHIKTFFSLKSVPENNKTELRTRWNTTLEVLNAVETMGYDDKIYFVMVFLLMLVDKETHTLWMREVSQAEVPTWDTFCKFMESRCDEVDAAIPKSNTQHTASHEKSNTGSKGANSAKSSKTTLAASFKQCAMCFQKVHPAFQCRTFVTASPAQRLQLAKKCQLCLNCLREGHAADDCTRSNCRKCGAKHSTMLHDSLFPLPPINPQPAPLAQGAATTQAVTPVTPPAPVVPSQSTPSNATQYSTLLSNFQRRAVSRQILMPTVAIVVQGRDGQMHKCRALLDSCSQLNFVTQSFVDKCKLSIHRQNGQVVVCGIGSKETTVPSATFFTFTSANRNFSMALEFQVLDKIVDDQPSISFEALWDLPQGIQLADDEYNQRGQIDVILGAEVFCKVLRPGRIEGSPTLFETVFGYVVAGSTPCNSSATLISSCISTCLCSANKNDNLSQLVEKFWAVEEPYSSELPLTQEEQLCEDHFTQNVTRDAEGRYVVRLPVRNNLHSLGNSEAVARRRFLCTERKLQRNPELREKYVAFMREYESLGHMRPLPESYNSPRPPIYLPHHPVIKTTSSSTPVRVVFDASAKTSSGISLNDVLMVGPKTQQDLFPILMRFREPEIVIKADIKKMYRQVLVHPDDQNLQRILWRESPEDPLITFLLATVTYGTGCASYLSTRSVKQLLVDEGDNFPLAKAAAARDFYVDDFLSGAASVAEAQELLRQIDQLMKKGAFVLSKWMSNCEEVLKDVPLSEREIKEPLNFNSSETISTLGLQWNPVSDEFTFKINPSSGVLTKRNILSEMSKIFDPLGLLAPIIIRAKILMQSLWQKGAGWDDNLEDTSVAQTWQEYQQSMGILTEFKIPRLIIPRHEQFTTQLTVFCDASEKAYGACIYLHAFDKTTKQLMSSLIASKTRVAPLKQISLPRLELCASELGMRLLNSVKSSLTVHIDADKGYSDSMIVLCWLSGEPKKWQTFVANRVSKIQGALPRTHWNHVPSSLNPADLASRGASPSQLKDNPLWWNGPDLKDIPAIQQELPDVAEEVLEYKVCGVVNKKNDFWEIIGTFSTHQLLIRSLVQCHRFVKYVRQKLRGENKNITPLSVKELIDMNSFVIHKVQREVFADDINRLEKQQSLSRDSRIKDLLPFVDSKGILRVEGRIHNAPVSYSQKHPILLPDYKHPFSRLIASKVHLETCHGGPQLMNYTCRQQYWPLRGLDLMKGARKNCVKCFRCKPKFMEQLMGNLPPCRLNFTRPFVNVGIDLCGYFLLTTPLRRNLSIKVYVVVFVCMVTHAIHLELVSELSTEAFLKSFRRFTAHWGRPEKVFCDNAKNFIGANKQLKEVRHILTNKDNQHHIFSYAAQRNIEFHFIPPRSPHFGGMWESAVKSFKHHFYRTVGRKSLTYEDMLTVLAEVSMCLNSRPLSPISSSPDDFVPLSPAHFFAGGPLIGLPQLDYTKTPENRLSKWQRNQQIVQHFWQRYQLEVFSHLQHRRKWVKKKRNLEIGDLVLVKEENLPPLMWALGRVIAVNIGGDKCVRAATIKTQSGVYSRTIHNLAKLPTEEELEEEDDDDEEEQQISQEDQNSTVQPGEDGKTP